MITYRNGAVVCLQDVADVYDSIKNDKAAAWYYNRETGGDRGVILAVMKLPGTNTIQVVFSVLAFLPTFRSELPPSVNLDIVYDRSQSIRESFHDVEFTLVLALGLVIKVISLFVRNLSAIVIPSLALPFSIIGTFSVTYLLDFSLKNLSTMALILATSFLVDHAIVMLENIVRHQEHGEAPMIAALRGSGEIGFTIISMRLSLAAVFIPILFMGGIVGRLFREFALTICVATLISGLVSLTFTQMLCSRFLRPRAKRGTNWLYDLSEKFFDGMFSAYSRSLRWFLNYTPMPLAISFLLIGLTVFMFVIIPKGFTPSDATGSLNVTVEA